jgi:hypothetical protein
MALEIYELEWDDDLFVVLRYKGRHRGRVITARPMTRAERRLYQQVRKGANFYAQDEEKT